LHIDADSCSASNLYRKLLAQLAGQRSLRRFELLDLPARQFPAPGQRRRSRPLRE
jgi:hypothetical protein